MPGQVAAFNNDLANTVEIDPPQQYAFGATHPKSAALFPLVEVAIRDWTMDIIDIGGGMDVAPEVIVICWQQGPEVDLEALYEASMGLAKCALEVLLADNAFGPTVGRLDGRDGARIAGSARALPADLAADGRSFTKWNVPTELRFTLPGRDGLS